MTDDSIMYTWSHPNEALVDYYRITVIDGTDNQIVNLNESEVVLPLLPGLSYNAELSAVSICGDASTSQTVSGNIGNDYGVK